MKLIFVLSLIIFINHCSFDNKTGIWKNEKSYSEKRENKIFKDFKEIIISEESYEKTKIFEDTLIDEIPDTIINKKWKDIFYNINNNSKNFQYSNKNQIVFKSKKLSRKKLDQYILYENDNLIASDIKGNIIVFSKSKNEIITKFNFYKKKYKKITKQLNLIVNEDIIYVSDNLGYIYAFNYKKNEIIWAKNYKIPFNSNLKIFKNKLISSNQNNNLYILNKTNGDIIKSIPTEEFYIKKDFKNNLSMNNKNELFFLNSFGSLYSINLQSLKVNWFNNFNQSVDLIPSKVFSGNIVVNNDNIVIISSNKQTFLINSDTGSILKKFNFSSKIKPIIINKHLFLLTNNNYLIAIDINSKNMIYSYEIGDLLEFKNKKSEYNLIKDLMILNGELFIFLNNSKVLIFSVDGKPKKSFKLFNKISSFPISIDGLILYLNKKNKLIVLN